MVCAFLIGLQLCLHSAIDLFHVLNILLSPFKFARPASYCVTYSFEVKTYERGLTGKFEWRQKNSLYREKGLCDLTCDKSNMVGCLQVVRIYIFVKEIKYS